jgi:alkylation response protein AidB-like acyl-CoA dehydrogenase
MEFTLNEEQQMIRDAAAAFLAKHCDSAKLRAVLETACVGLPDAPGHGPASAVANAAADAPARAADDAADGAGGGPLGGAAHDAGLWREMGTRLGWCALPVPEHCGGMGMGQVERALLMEQMGRRLPAVPYFASACLAADALQYGAPQAGKPWLEQLAAGEATAALALPRLARWDAAHCTVTARRGAHGYVLDGAVAQVMGGAQADVLLVPARLDDGDVALFALRAGTSGMALAPLRTLDMTRAIASLQLTNVQAGAEAWLAAGAALQAGLRRTTTLAALALAAEQVGAARQCLDLTLAYVGERVQFGRAIASFQAVKHRCAHMMVALESAASMVLGAALLADGGTVDAAGLETDVACAKQAANHALFFCAQEAIQLHGGVGFTWEYDPHLYFKRAQAARSWFGDDSACLRQVAQALADGALHRSGGDTPPGEFEHWLEAQLSGRFAGLRHRGGPGDEDAFPGLRKQWERAMAAAGWTCAGWPKEHGGAGLSLSAQVARHEQYARAGGPGRVGHIGEGLIGPTLIALGTPDQQRRHLPGIVAGTTLWCQGYSEPNAGSDLANVQTRAVRDEASGDWIVTGQKVWTSLAHESQWIFVVARCEPGSRGGKGLIFLLMPLDQPGIEIRPIRQISGSAEFNEVFFDGARARACDVVGKPGDGWQVAMALLGFERGLSTLGQQMQFLHELELVMAAARDNGSWDDRAVRDRIARAWIGLRTMRCNALRMLSGADRGQLAPESLIYKYHWSNWHRDLGELAMDVLGVEGNVLEDSATDEGRRQRLQSLFLFSRADTIYAGSNEIQLNIIAERGLGMPKEPRGNA